MAVRVRSGATRAVAANAGWLMVERIVRGVVALTVTAAAARHLGPAGFGTVSLALSFVLLFSTFWTLGLSGIVVRELVQRVDQTNETLGTVFGLRLISGIAGVGVILVAAYLLGLDSQTIAAIAVIAVATLAFSLDGIDFWLQSQLLGGWTVFTRVAGVLASATATVVLIVTDGPLIAFAAAIGLEYPVTGLALLFAYLRLGRRFRSWRFSFSLVGTFLSMSWPLIISGALYSINMKVDQLMLGTLVGTNAVGTYAAAARLSEVWYFVPTIIAGSAFPALLRVRAEDPVRYRRRMQQLYDVMTAISLPLAVVVAILSPWIIFLIYGEAYAASANVLAIHIFAGPFVFLGAALSKWLIAENHLMFSMIRHGLGAFANVALNLFLIPRAGPIGAAIATLVSYAVAGVLATWVYPPTRTAAVQMVLSLGLPIRLLGAALRGPDSPNSPGTPSASPGA